MSFSFDGIDHVQLAAPKGTEEKARHFFIDILGMAEITKPANLAARGGVWFQVGHHQLHIGIEDDFVPAKKAHPAFLVNNLNSLRERLVEHGVKVKDDTSLEGANRFYVDDPFGNRMEFLEWITK
ncbi:VOC family protein [Alicyclobacillus sp. ALC3]|uniref:VOC family protein n=1 Tax=Alicyclobacillus sp. ALC3 TaxID=2796143 RepID=UPI002378715D|nr:VOC family protein [Alicyclobacillus sp. ALC3]WDL96558.1 VOC family protein [Alicyclobacillus sp. ALC3]